MTTAPVRRRGPGSRAGEHHPTREELVAAAERLADEGGLAALSVAAVAAAAGHAKGTFYVHFADRSELLVALHRRFHEAVLADVEAATAALDPGPDRARQRVLAFLDASRRRAGVRAMLVEARSDPAIGAEVARRNAGAVAVLREDLGGVDPDPEELAHLLVIATADLAVRESAAAAELPAGRRVLLGVLDRPAPEGELRPR